MKCIVINLPRADVRRQDVAEQFNSLGITFEFLEAVDWRYLTQQERSAVDRQARCREGRRPLTDGMIACHLSHRKAIERVAHGREDFAAIFEDDVRLSPKITSAFSLLEPASQPKALFDILFLHRNKTDLPFVSVHELDKNFAIGGVKYTDSGAVSYIISRTAARRFLDFYPRVIHHCDHALHEYWENGLKVFSLDPPVVFHGNTGGHHSFIREAAATRPRRSPWTYLRRVQSLVREEIRKRWSFHQLSRTR